MTTPQTPLSDNSALILSRSAQKLITTVGIVNLAITAPVAILSLCALTTDAAPGAVNGLVFSAIAVAINVGILRRKERSRQVYIGLTIVFLGLLLFGYIDAFVSDNTGFGFALTRGIIESLWFILILAPLHVWQIASIVILSRQSVRLRFSS